MNDHVGPDEYNNVPTDEMKRAIHKVRTAVMIMRETILKDVPEGRSRSLALTNLDQMRMWSLEAITHHYEPSPVANIGMDPQEAEHAQPALQ